MKNMPRRDEDGNYSGSKSRSPPCSVHPKHTTTPLDGIPLKKRSRPHYESSGNFEGPTKGRLNEVDQQNEAAVQENTSKIPLSLPPPPIAKRPMQSQPSNARFPNQRGSVVSRIDSGVLIKKLSEDNQASREEINKVRRSNERSKTTTSDGSNMTEDVLNKAQIAKLRVQGDESIKTLDFRGVFSLKKTRRSRLLDVLDNGVDELLEMASSGEPLWVWSENGKKEVLDYDEYTHRHSSRSSAGSVQLTVEASRETGTVPLDMNNLVKFFMNTEEWKVLFSGLIMRAFDLGTLNVSDKSCNRLAKLMYVELQYPTPLVCSREFVLIRYCVKLRENKYAILDISVDQVDDTATSMFYCQKKPSGCIIEKSGDICKVTMVEHGEFKHNDVSNIYNSVIYDGQAFSAERWVNTLQQQCERLSNYVHTNPPIESSVRKLPPASKASMLKVAHRLTASLLKSICGSQHRTWLKMKKQGQEIHFMTRASEIGEPEGLIASTVLSTVLPIPHLTLYNYLRKKQMGAAAYPFVCIGTDARYSMTIHSTTGHMRDSLAAANKCVLKECNSNGLESTVAFSEIAGKSVEEMVWGENLNGLEILAAGFSIVRKREEWQPLVLSKHIDRRTKEYSILCIGQQVVVSRSTSATLTTENLETLAGRVLSSLSGIKYDMKCRD